MSGNLTYKTILDRCKADALEYILAMPKENTLDKVESE